MVVLDQATDSSTRRSRSAESKSAIDKKCLLCIAVTRAVGSPEAHNVLMHHTIERLILLWVHLDMP